MSPPAWVQKLVPSAPNGADLLAAERAGSEVNVERLSEMLHTRDSLEQTAKIEEIIKAQPVFDKNELLSMGRVDTTGTRRSTRLPPTSPASPTSTAFTTACS
jgi:acyl-CoA oxidase